ncbi:hypothetical protein HZH68_002559 [Vespula germanica]|uniref:Uncharacterized protein n=1 Tax=Vespula germanica TaxID=30212 RepID=A0A834NMJ7_VESGE|nr:hypothetical protein HZH68_002559 [Vespula germanica]
MSFVNCDRQDYIFLRISIIRPSWDVFSFLGCHLSFQLVNTDIVPVVQTEKAHWTIYTIAPPTSNPDRNHILRAMRAERSLLGLFQSGDLVLILGPNVHQVPTPQTRVEHLTSIRSKSSRSKFRVLIGFCPEADPIQSALSQIP